MSTPTTVEDTVTLPLPLDVARAYFDLTAPDGDLPDPVFHDLLKEVLPTADGTLMEVVVGGVTTCAVRMRGEWLSLASLEPVASDEVLDQRGAEYRPLRLAGSGEVVVPAPGAYELPVVAVEQVLRAFRSEASRETRARDVRADAWADRVTSAIRATIRV